MEKFLTVAMCIFVVMFFIGILYSVVQKVVSVVKLKKLKEQLKEPFKDKPIEGEVENLNADSVEDK